MYSILRILPLLILVLILDSCGEPTIVGADLFDPEELDIQFTDDIDIIAKSVSVDSVKTYFLAQQDDLVRCRDGSLPEKIESLPLTNYIGNINDPAFGTTTASIYSQVRLLDNPPNYSDGNLDSLILVLAYDTSAFYGDINSSFDIDVFRVNEDLDLQSEAFEFSTFSTIPARVGFAENVRFSKESPDVFIPGRDTSTALVPQLRIPIKTTEIGSGSLGLTIFNDSLANTSDEEFVKLVNGLLITAKNVDNTLIGFDLTSRLQSRLQLFYTVEGEPEVYNYFLSGKRFTHFDNDRTGSDAANGDGNPASGEELLYIAGQAGYDIEFDVSDVLTLQDVAVNKAELELTVATQSTEESRIYPPIQNLLVSQMDDNSQLNCIRDVEIAVNNGDVGLFFGGELVEIEENGTTVQKYKLNITSHIQEILAGRSDTKLIVSINSRIDNVGRSVIYGPGHPTYPAKLNITYTAP